MDGRKVWECRIAYMATVTIGKEFHRQTKGSIVLLRITRIILPLAFLLAVTLSTGTALAQALKGAIYTTDKAGTAVNQNIYGALTDVYLSGGPQNDHPPGLPDGTYYFQVTDPTGKTLLSTDNAACRQLQVEGAAASRSP